MTNYKEHIEIEAKNLSIGYSSKKKNTVINSNLNFSLYKGNFVSVLGKNGIGKSTLLRTIAKVQPQLNGEIFINSKELSAISAIELSKMMALVLTERLPESNLTVFELVALGRQPYTNWVGNLNEKDINVIKESLKLTKTEHLANQRFYELSDGQLQRVLIARALAQETDIIILDEPTAHLDVQHKMETFELLKNLVKKLNKTIIISTHEIHTALQTSDELWLMTENAFITGKTEELVAQNKIEKLFKNETISFDKSTLRFSLSSKK